MNDARRSGRRMRRAAVVDGFVLQRSRIGQLLTEEAALEVVHESGTLRQFMTWLSKADRARWPHLLSLGVPADAADSAPLRAASALRRAGIRILLVAPPSSRTNARKLMDCGADGIVSTSDGEPDFVAAVTTVLAGAPFVSSHAQGLIDGTHRAARLSTQEERVLTLYASGMTIAEVASAIGVRHDTARKYLSRVRDKYTAAGRPARTKLELARIAWAEGFIVTELPAASEAG